MSGKKPSPPPSGIDFLETGHDDRYMKQIFEQIDKVPDEEPAEELPTRGKIKSQQQRDSPFAALSGPDDQIDLHGKTREEAIMIVQNFVKTCHAQRLRHILVITGKGQHSPYQGPVLKTTVALWLKKNGHAYLREFHDAPPRFGGSGAIWIELK